jgi:hypothetical protein
VFLLGDITVLSSRGRVLFQVAFFKRGFIHSFDKQPGTATKDESGVLTREMGSSSSIFLKGTTWTMWGGLQLHISE